MFIEMLSSAIATHMENDTYQRGIMQILPILH